MRVEPPTLAGIVDRMERDGWLGALPLPGGSPPQATLADRVRGRTGLGDDRLCRSKGPKTAPPKGSPRTSFASFFDALQRIRDNVASSSSSSSNSATTTAPTPAFSEDPR